METQRISVNRVVREFGVAARLVVPIAGVVVAVVILAAGGRAAASTWIPEGVDPGRTIVAVSVKPDTWILESPHLSAARVALLDPVERYGLVSYSRVDCFVRIGGDFVDYGSGSGSNSWVLMSGPAGRLGWVNTMSIDSDW